MFYYAPPLHYAFVNDMISYMAGKEVDYNVDQIVQWLNDEPSLSWTTINKRLGKGRRVVEKWLARRNIVIKEQPRRFYAIYTTHYIR